MALPSRDSHLRGETMTAQGCECLQRGMCRGTKGAAEYGAGGGGESMETERMVGERL